MNYRTILADPPWRYQQKLRMQDNVARSSDAQYKTLSLDEVCKLGEVTTRTCFIAGHEVDEIAFLWLWITNPMLLSGDHVSVCRAWGFEPKQIVPWVKGRLTGDRLILNTGMGWITRGVTEHLVIATRGTYTDYVKEHNVHGLIVAPEESMLLSPRGAHSKKPVEQYTMIERACEGPYLELFARERHDGWDAWGDQL